MYVKNVVSLKLLTLEKFKPFGVEEARPCAWSNSTLNC